MRSTLTATRSVAARTASALTRGATATPLRQFACQQPTPQKTIGASPALQATSLLRTGASHRSVMTSALVRSLARDVVARPSATRTATLASPLSLPRRAHGHSHDVEDDPEEQARALAKSGLTLAQARAKDLHVTQLGLGANIALTVAKFVAGVAGNSMALIADAVHGLSDMASDAVTLLVLKHASAPADVDHPYGHGRIEDVGTLAVSGIVLATGLGIGWHAVERIVELAALSAGTGLWHDALATVDTLFHSHSHSLVEPAGHAHAHDAAAAIAGAADAVSGTPGAVAASADAAAEEDALPHPIALVVALVAVVVKEALFHITKRVAAQTGSRIVDINAWHHRSDAASSLVAVVGVAGAMMKWPILDPVAALVVAGMITKEGASMAVSVLHDITDRQLPDDTLDALRKEIEGCRAFGVLDCYGLRGRKMGRNVLVDATLVVPSHFSVSAAREVTEFVRARVKARLPDVAEILLSIDAEGSATTRAGIEADRLRPAHGAPHHEHEHEHGHGHGADGHSHGGGPASAALEEPRAMRSLAEVERDVQAVVNSPRFAKYGVRLGQLACHYVGGTLTATVEIMLSTAVAESTTGEPAPIVPACVAATAVPAATSTPAAGVTDAVAGDAPVCATKAGARRLPPRGPAPRMMLPGLCNIQRVSGELREALESGVADIDHAVIVLRLTE